MCALPEEPKRAKQKTKERRGMDMLDRFFKELDAGNEVDDLSRQFNMPKITVKEIKQEVSDDNIRYERAMQEFYMAFSRGN